MNNENNTSAVVAQKESSLNFFGNIEAFEAGQRMAKLFAASKLVPDTYRGDVGSCLIAMNMASRIGADIMQVMQSLYIVHGKPAFSSAFLIACFNQTKRFTPIRYEFSGEPNTDTWTCRAVTTDKSTGELIEGVAVSIAMAKAEGWYNKAGSKWKTMPELMMRYRAATFLIRATAPEITLGFTTTEEARDVIDITDRTQVVQGAPASLAEAAMQAVAEDAEVAEDEPQPESENQEQQPTNLFD